MANDVRCSIVARRGAGAVEPSQSIEAGYIALYRRGLPTRKWFNKSYTGSRAFNYQVQLKLFLNRCIQVVKYGHYPHVRRGLAILWVLTISWLAFFRHLGSIGLVDETEPLFAEAARQMTVTGDWITPFFNDEPRFDKPPLIYWLMAIAYLVFGVNEWAARLPSALAAAGLTALGFYTLWRFGILYPAVDHASSDPAVQLRQRWQLELSAWLGAAMIALNLETVVWGRIGVSDMLLSGCMGSALLTFFIGYAQRQQKQRWYLAFYVLSALAVLAKGPVGIVLPGLIIGAFLLYLGNGREVLREMAFLRGSLIFLILTVPWYVLVIQANGAAYIQSFFGYHNLERFTTVVNSHDAPWYFYIFVILGGFAPWSIYLPAAIAQVKFWQSRHWRHQPRAKQLGLFALFWFLGIFGFFSVAVTKLPSYVLPLIPAAAILVALLWSHFITQQGTRSNWGVQLSGWLNVLLFLILAGAILYSPHWLGNDPALPNLPLRVQQSGLPLVGTFIWTTAAVVGILCLLTQRIRWLWSINFFSVVAFLIFVFTPASFILDAERQLPLRELAETAVRVQHSGEELIMFGFKKPSLVFYTQQSVTYINDPAEVISYLQSLNSNPSDSTAALLLASREDFSTLGLESDAYQQIAAAGVYHLIRIDNLVKQ